MTKNFSSTLYHLIFQTLYEIGVIACILIMKKLKPKEVRDLLKTTLIASSRGEI